MTRCANTAQICSKVVAKALDVYGVTAVCWSSSVWPIPVRPIPVKALEDAFEGILIKEPQIAFFVARRTL